AGASKIVIKISGGGVNEICVQDDGSGIKKDDLELALESHATSKIQSMQDIVSVNTLGFRGEALSSIASVSKLELVSRIEKDTAYSISCLGGKLSKISAISRDIGTTVRVKDLFYNIPARRKFLKTPKTEYRHILEVFTPVVLINPDVHFILESAGKSVYNLPAVQDASPKSVHPQRVSDVLKKLDFVNLFYEGNAITIGGMVGHPKHHVSRSTSQYIFVNGRPVWDSGIAKSVSLGASRFIPDGHKVPVVIAIGVPFEQVDVNVHPRKVEVRFANPYRIYSAVEQAVKEAYKKLGKVSEDDVDFDRFRKSGESGMFKSSDVGIIGAGRKYSVKESIDFSKKLIQDSVPIVQKGAFNTDGFSQDSTGGSELRARQFLNRYIVVAVNHNLWIIDQHAAAERVRFEKLLKEYDGKGIESQSLLIPIIVDLQKADIAFISENLGVFKYLGYRLGVGKSKVEITEVPAILSDADHQKLFVEIVGHLRDVDEMASKKNVLKDKYRDVVMATMACHSSVRMNRKLSDQESSSIVKSLLLCDNSYSCPHGRPIVWKMSVNVIDKHFDR
ncbi:MAG: DNA mismatch repair endonuclease MutL, partial [Patescibacteria group bacterium]|nr:DNA mismatch repair endonuclease MutL [Patescibacteria group bacterium]